MKRKVQIGLALAGLTVVVAAQAQTTNNPALLRRGVNNRPPAAPPAPIPLGKFANVDDQGSYALGMNMATDIKRNLARAGYEVHMDMVVKGFDDAIKGGETLLSTNDVAQVFQRYLAELRTRADEKRKALAAVNKKAGAEFLAANRTKDGVVTLPDGLQYKVVKAGDGPKPHTNDIVNVNYRGTLINGTEFDSSYTKGQPATFSVRGVVKGWTEALQLMPVGSKWQLFVPSELAYGERGMAPKIGPGETLIFDLELVGIKQSTPPPTPQVTSDIIKVPSQDELKKGAKIEVLKPEDVARLQKEEAAKKANPQQQ